VAHVDGRKEKKVACSHLMRFDWLGERKSTNY